MAHKFRGEVMDCQKIQVRSFEGQSAKELSKEITEWVRTGKGIQVEHISMCYKGNDLVILIFYRIYVP